MKYVIGIDGGATKTHLKALSFEKQVVGERFGGASNLASLCEDDVQKNLYKLLDEFYTQTGFAQDDCSAICLGTAGAGSERMHRLLYAMLEAYRPKTQVMVTNDALPALYGGTLTGVGIIIIAGTGSICLARNEAGKIHRTGGWGHILGDEGSGYDISVQILKAVMRAYDERGKPTLLTDLVLEHLKLSQAKDIIDYVYHSGKSKCELASIAFLCDIAQKQGDKVAEHILHTAALSLSDMVVATAKALCFVDENKVVCAYSGSVLLKSEFLRKELETRLFSAAPMISLQECKEDAAYGCALIAMESEKI